MLKKIILIFLICLSKFNCKELPQIDLYFETICPGCQYFITGSFADFLNHPGHSELATVKFHPYGNAIEEKKGDLYEFTCQHGENECYGNVIEVCALNKLPYEEGLNFILCMEKGIQKFQNDMNKALDNCLDSADLKKNILDCAAGKEGNDLQHKVAEGTPDHEYVPWITFEGEHDEKVQNKLMDDMVGFLCNLEDNIQKEICVEVYKKKLSIEKNMIPKEKDYEVCKNVSFMKFADLKFLS